MIEDEEFFAWLDGELEGEAAARVAALVEASPELSAKAAEHHVLGQKLLAAFVPVMDESASPRFAEAEVGDIAEQRAANDRRMGWLGVPQWAAMAATLALGLAVGQLVDLRPEVPIESRNGTIIAAASLDRALDRQLASAGPTDGIRIGLTFRDRRGAICRSFSGAAGNGLACRAGDGEWQVEGLFASTGEGGEYRMAAGESPQLAAMIDKRIAGEPFDAAQERAAFERDWR
jgi:hypothetical protein